VKTVLNARETRYCSARLDPRRAMSRCGAAALDYGDVRVAGELVEIPLCQRHFRKLRDSDHPLALKRLWTPDPGEPVISRPASREGRAHNRASSAHSQTR